MGNMFGKRNNAANNNSTMTGGKSRKYKPYRNRPSIRQILLEIVSFLLILAAAPAFLGGTISIFVMYFTLVLGLIGLFAWTRRHAALFILLALCVIGLCIVNIVLRGIATHDNGSHGQCLPFFNYGYNFHNNGSFIGSSANGGHNNGTFTNNSTANTMKVREVEGVDDDSDDDNDNSNNGAGTFYNNNANNRNMDHYNNSIWCGNRFIVFVTNAIIIGLALIGLLLALTLLGKRRNVNTATTTTETKTTRTIATA